MRKLHTNIFYIFFGVTMTIMTFMVAKTSAATGNPTPTLSPSPTLAPSPTPSPILAPSPTPSPTLAPSPTPTPTPSPTPTPTPSGSPPSNLGRGAPLCLPISVNNKNPKGGEEITLVCGGDKLDYLGNSYTFIIHEPNPSKKSPDNFNEIVKTVTNANSILYTVPKVLGNYSAWCQQGTNSPSTGSGDSFSSGNNTGIEDSRGSGGNIGDGDEHTLPVNN